MTYKKEYNHKKKICNLIFTKILWIGILFLFTNSLFANSFFITTFHSVKEEIKDSWTNTTGETIWKQSNNKENRVSPNANLSPAISLVSPGEMVLTCAAYTTSEFVLATVNAPSLSYSTSTQTPTKFSHPAWTAGNLGNLYFTEFANDGAIFAAASFFTSRPFLSTPTQAYGTLGGGANNLNAAGTVYKMDVITGAPMIWTRLPQQNHTFVSAGPSDEANPTRTTGPGLGGITRDPINDIIYIVNMEDGKIYAFDANDPGPFPLTSADAIDIFDPMTTDSGATGMPPLGDRPFGIDYYNGQLFYTVHDWNSVTERGKIIVRKVSVNASGVQDATDVQLINVEKSPSTAGITTPVGADIEVNQADGRIAVGSFSSAIINSSGVHTYYETNMPNLYNHNAGVWVYNQVGTELNFSSVGQELFASSANNYTATGGVAWNHDNTPDILWMSGGDLKNEDGNWGVVGYNYSTLTPSYAQENSTSYIQFIFPNPSGNVDAKGNGGDVDIFSPVAAMIMPFDLALRKVVNTTISPGPYTPDSNVSYTLCVFNQGTVSAANIYVAEYLPTGMTFTSYGTLPTVSTQNTALTIATTGNGNYTISALSGGEDVCIDLMMKIGPNVTENTSLINNAEIIYADGGIDEDDPLSNTNNGTTNELATDNNLNDDGPNTPGTIDNPTDEDDYDPALILIECPVLKCLPIQAVKNL